MSSRRLCGSWKRTASGDLLVPASLLRPCNRPRRRVALRYCPACGADLSSLGLTVAPMGYCHRCGAPLSPQGASVPLCLACGSVAGDGPDCRMCQRHFGESNHRLQFVQGLLAGAVFRIPEGDYEVGRQQFACDPLISRRHLRIICLNGSVAIQDLGSTNKTYVGGQLALSPMTLSRATPIHIAGRNGRVQLLKGAYL